MKGSTPVKKSVEFHWYSSGIPLCSVEYLVWNTVEFHCILQWFPVEFQWCFQWNTSGNFGLEFSGIPVNSQWNSTEIPLELFVFKDDIKDKMAHFPKIVTNCVICLNTCDKYSRYLFNKFTLMCNFTIYSHKMNAHSKLIKYGS